MAARLTVISPHLDDAVFGAGELIAAHPGAVVITVFAGIPPRDEVTGWDRDCGFRGSREAMFARRREDTEALALLGATPCWLDFCDAQYAPPPDPAAIGAALARELTRHEPDVVAFPLGLFHSDHKLVSRAAVELLDAERSWLAYEDALYRRMPRAVEDRLAELVDAGIMIGRITAVTPNSPALKTRAVLCYSSQLRGLGTPGRPGQEDLAEPERYWRLAR
jgi:LmbE family N-acetylglucosaminyl deacetylase